MKIVWAILLGGLAAGALDIVYAFVAYGPLSYGVTPEQVLHSVAAGLIGRDAARVGGMETAGLGLGLHLAIATLMAAAYVLAATRLSVLTRRAMLCARPAAGSRLQCRRLRCRPRRGNGAAGWRDTPPRRWRVASRRLHRPR